MAKVVIIGAGISGLTLAWKLQQSDADVTVFEKERHAGGTMQTVHDGEWLIESGPNSALETTPLFQELFMSLGIRDRMRYADGAADKRYILREGRLHALPMSPGAFLATSLWTTRAKIRLMKEPFIGQAREDESVAAFVVRRLGSEFLDYAINPFVAGVYAGNPEQLSVRSAFPKLFALEQEYGGLVKGMIKGRKERKSRAEKAKDRAKMFSFAGGMAEFPEAIAHRLGERLILQARVTALTRREGEFREPRSRFAVSYEVNGVLSSMEADAVILSLPAYSASGIVRGLSSTLPEVLNGVSYPPVAEVFLGYRADRVGIPLDGFGFLVPAVEGRKILGTIWSSVLFEGRAPKGHVALTTFLGGARQPGLASRDDKDLLALVGNELRDIMSISGDPAYVAINRWEKSIPQYNLGYDAILLALEKCERENPGLFFCSNFRGGIAVGDCVMSAEKTAAGVLGFLNKKTTIHQTAIA